MFLYVSGKLHDAWSGFYDFHYICQNEKLYDIKFDVNCRSFSTVYFIFKLFVVIQFQISDNRYV